MAEFFKPRDFVHRVRSGKRERLTVTAGQQVLTAATYGVSASGGADDVSYRGPKSPTAAVIQVQTQPIAFTTDGTTLTDGTTKGFIAQANDLIYLNTIQEIQNFKAWRNGASDAAIEVQYFYGY